MLFIWTLESLPLVPFLSLPHQPLQILQRIGVFRVLVLAPAFHSREPEGDPRLVITRKPDTIFDYAIEDFEVQDYSPQGALKAPIAV